MSRETEHPLGVSRPPVGPPRCGYRYASNGARCAAVATVQIEGNPLCEEHALEAFTASLRAYIRERT